MADPTYMRDAKPVAATPDYMRNAQPVSPDPDIIAHAAADDTKKSAQAIDVSKQTGLALGYIAGGLDESIKAIQKQKFAAQLYGRPVMSDWAAQSPQHAALVRPDAEELGKTEGWFSGWGDALGAGLLDIMHAEAMREYMGYSLDKYRSQSAAYVESKVREFAAGGRDPRDVAAFRWKLQHPSMGPLGGDALSLETAAREYDSKPHGFPQAVLRAVPQIGLYTGGAVVAGPVGVAGLLYAQNKGVLARQIQLAQTNSPDKLTPEEVDKYATVGSAASAVATAGLLGPLLRSMPGAKEALQATVGTVFERGVSTGLGQAFIRSLSSYGIHSFMGATGMALQASINAATVRKATSGELDFGQFGRETADTFWKVLPIALTFSAYGPTRDFMADRGRLNMAPLERARLDEQVALAKKMQLTKTAPERALELFGLMGRGAKVFIDWKAAKTMEGLPPADVAAAEAAQDSVAVPMADYLTKLADQHESVKDDVKLTAGGMTMNEARARDKELRALGPEAQTLLGKQTPDDVLQYELPFPKEAAVPEAKPAAAATTAEPKFQASFQNKETGEVINTGAFHDLTKLPGGTNAHASGKFVDGFTDQTGKFYTREEAAKALNVKGKELASGGLATEDLARMQKERLAEVAAEMAKLYGGTVEKWQERLTPELMDALREEGSKGAVAPEEHAARVIEAMPSGEIDAAPYERLAKKSQRYIEDAAEKARSGSAAGAQASSPADVAVLSTYELARDVNNAKAAKATEVRAEMDKISETLNKAAGNDKLRALMARAGSPLLHLFDVLTESSGTANPKSVLDANRKGWMAAHQEAVAAGAASFSPEAIDYANERMRNSLGEALQWFSDAARPVQFDERVLGKFLADPKPLKELRPFEVRAISDAVKQLTTAAKEEGIIRRGDAQATVDEVSAEIRGELRQNPSKGLPQPSGVPTGFWRNRLLDANAANAVQLRPKNNLRQKSAAAAKWIFDRINQAVYVRDGYFRDVGEKWKTAFDAAPPEVAKLAGNTYDLSDKLPTPGMEPLKAVPRQYIWKLARHRMSAGNMERVLSTSGWDGAVVDNILFDDPATKLTVPEWDYLQSLADVNEKYVWPKLKEHFEKFYGLAPPKTAGVPFKVQLADGTWKDYAGGYEPLKRDARPGVAPQAEPTKGIAQYWGRDFQTPWTPGSVKERVDNSHYLVNMDWDSSRATMARALHWLAFDQPVRDVAKLLNDQRLAADMNEFMGEGRADMTRGWLKSSATQQSQSVPEGMEIVGRMFGWQRRLQLMQIVGGSARLAVTQLSHPIGLMLGGEVNPIHGIGAFFSTFKPVAMEDGNVRLFPNWNDAINYGEEVQHRADRAYATLRQTWDMAGPNAAKGPLGALKEVALKTAGLYLHAVDRLTTSWAWTAFHNEAVAKGAEPFSREAIDYANGKTQDVMPVHDIETAAPILTNRQMGGFLIMHGFKNTLYNMRQDALAKSVKDFHLAETPGQYGGAVARTAGRVALGTAMFGGFAIMGKFTLGWGQQEDETKGQWLARDFLGGQFVDIPIIGGLAEPLAKLMVGGKVTKRDFSSYGNPGIAAANKVYELLGNLVNDAREDYKKVFDALETVLFLGGVPSRPVRTSAEHVYEMLMGENYDAVDSSVGDSAGRMVYTEKQWESIKRSLTPDED